MYATTYKTFMGRFEFFLAIAVVIALFEAVFTQLGLGPSIVVYGMVALFSHRIVLINETYGITKNRSVPGGERLPFIEFLLRYAVVTLIFVAALVIFSMLVAGMAGGFENGFIIPMIVAIGLGCLALGALLARWGTIFPAVVAKGDKTIAVAAERSRGRFVETFQKLVIGPFVVAIASTAVYFAAQFVVHALPAAIAVPATFLSDVLGSLLGLIPTHMTAVILSQLYQDVESVPINQR